MMDYDTWWSRPDVFRWIEDGPDGIIHFACTKEQCDGQALDMIDVVWEIRFKCAFCGSNDTGPMLQWMNDGGHHDYHCWDCGRVW